MNWTEGNLARHSRRRKNTDLLARQKKYFAKARSGFFQHSGGHRPPPSISFLKSPNSKPSDGCFKPPSREAEKNSHSSSSILGTYEGNTGVSYSNRSSHRVHEEKMMLVSSANYFIHEKLDHSRLEQDFKRNRGTAENEHTDLLYLRRKRQKLLQQRDWSGITKYGSVENHSIPPAPPPMRQTGWSKQWDTPELTARRINTLSRRHPPNLSQADSRGSEMETNTAYSIHIGNRWSRDQHAANHTARATQPLSGSPPRSSSGCSKSEIAVYQRGIETPIRRVSQDDFLERNYTQGVLGQGEDQAKSRRVWREEPATLSHATVAPLIHNNTVLRVPIPQRYTDNCKAVLQWSPTRVVETASSVYVEDGRTCANPSPRIGSEDAAWRKWLGSSSVSRQLTSPTLPPQATMSPRVGELPSLMSHELPPFDMFANDRPELLVAVTSVENSPIQTTSEEMDSRHNRNEYQSQEHSNAKIISTTPEELQVPDQPALTANKLNLSTNTTKKQTQEDMDNSAWMSFLFGDNSSEIISKALDEAASQTASKIYQNHQRLPETDPRVTTYDDLARVSSTAICGTPDKTNEPLTTEQPAIHGQSEEAYPTLSPIPEPPTAMSSDLEVGIGNTSTRETDSTMGHVEEHQDEVTVPHKTLFTMPTTFVGKLAGTRSYASGAPTALNRYPASRPARAGRSKRRALDGRPEIRKLPDFDEDPIEEF